jgi:hypothetical protein
LTQVSAGLRPFLRQADGFYFLEFDTVDDQLVSPAITLKIGSYIVATMSKTAENATRAFVLSNNVPLGYIGLANVTTLGRASGQLRIAAGVANAATSQTGAWPVGGPKVLDSLVTATTVDVRSNNLLGGSQAHAYTVEQEPAALSGWLARLLSAASMAG